MNNSGRVTATALAPDLFSSAAREALDWQAFRPGIEIVKLYSEPGGRATALLRYAPGAALARHLHNGFEHILVLSGAQVDENGEHRAGALLIHAPGSSHSITSPTGCVVLAIWEQPVTFLS